jgi:CoA-transferase family III
MMGLWEAKKTRRGQVIDLAQYEAVAQTQGNTLPLYTGQGVSYGHTGNRAPGFQAYDTFKCQDGWVFIGAVGGAMFPRVPKFLGLDPEVYTYEACSRDAAAVNSEKGRDLDRRLRDYCAERPSREVEAALNKAQIGCARVFSTADLRGAGDDSACARPTIRRACPCLWGRAQNVAHPRPGMARRLRRRRGYDRYPFEAAGAFGIRDRPTLRPRGGASNRALHVAPGRRRTPLKQGNAQVVEFVQPAPAESGRCCRGVRNADRRSGLSVSKYGVVKALRLFTRLARGSKTACLRRPRARSTTAALRRNRTFASLQIAKFPGVANRSNRRESQSWPLIWVCSPARSFSVNLALAKAIRDFSACDSIEHWTIGKASNHTSAPAATAFLNKVVGDMPILSEGHLGRRSLAVHGRVRSRLSDMGIDLDVVAAMSGAVECCNGARRYAPPK